jgi:cytidylate kinase
MLIAAAHQDSLIVVGRAAQYLLPRDKGLAVRLVASPKYRCRQIAQREQLDEADAQRLMDEADQGRAEFVHRYFHHDIADPHLYDLVVNVERLGIDAAVQLILAGIEQLRSR